MNPGQESQIFSWYREVLGLKGEQPFNAAIVSSADEIRKEMNRYIPENEKLSDLAMS